MPSLNVKKDKSFSEHIIRDVLNDSGLTANQLAQYLGVSLVSVVRWERGDIEPDAAAITRLDDLKQQLHQGKQPDLGKAIKKHIFASRGAKRISNDPLLRKKIEEIRLTDTPGQPIVTRLKHDHIWSKDFHVLHKLLSEYAKASPTIKLPAREGISAGKNTYTYDAHTYHTKVPPQGIAEVLKQYLPQGGLVLDPFAGSGMTGVAARTLGFSAILNELSPAASFIADRFTRKCDPNLFAAAVKKICDSLEEIRRDLYTTQCRTCGKDTEILYMVWSYKVTCPHCDHKFVLWDNCRKYGKTVREHKILKEFPCPHCQTTLKKPRLQRSTAEPVLIGYKCCSNRQTEHPLSQKDKERLKRIEKNPPLVAGYVPYTQLPDGVNLSQPKKHGLTSIDKFYTGRNLAAMSNLWREIHRIEDEQIAGFLAFVFTSLYQRVTRLSEFRFWGGSGNTAHFNVPYIFNEANVFLTFERKARTIQDHLETTAKTYKGRTVVHTGSATNLDFLPNNSIDLIFTDPPFGANINYSEMNIIWESWLGAFTDSTHEAIVNRVQKKDAARYGELMTESLKEAYRVLRPGHWMILVFMNSSQEIWKQLSQAISNSGFSLERVDIFDKQHGTFKQYVSDNTAGCDLLLHCRKSQNPAESSAAAYATEGAVQKFLEEREGIVPRSSYLHVNRIEEIDYRKLYSEFLAANLLTNGSLIDFSDFRDVAVSMLERS